MVARREVARSLRLVRAVCASVARAGARTEYVTVDPFRSAPSTSADRAGLVVPQQTYRGGIQSGGTAVPQVIPTHPAARRSRATVVACQRLPRARWPWALSRSVTARIEWPAARSVRSSTSTTCSASSATRCTRSSLSLNPNGTPPTRSPRLFFTASAPRVRPRMTPRS